MGLGDVYKRQNYGCTQHHAFEEVFTMSPNLAFVENKNSFCTNEQALLFITQKGHLNLRDIASVAIINFV